jgi:microcystin-dependent protein
MMQNNKEVDMNSYVGQITLFPTSYAPEGWALCQGQLLSVQQYTSLFVVIGTKFGGDGMTNFKLPKMNPPVEGLNYCIALDGEVPVKP